jgi:hypothetical protein
VSAADWSAELESNGRVVFRPRPRPVAVRLGAFAVLTAGSAWTNIEHLRADGLSGALAVLRLTALAAFVYGAAVASWQLATNRPTITVDAEGITRGRSLRWSGIAGIEERPLSRAVQVNPVDRRTRPILIPGDHVEDLNALARWLRSLLEQHRG